ncbi:FeoB-associated Cys-rich membrane protein [Desulfovibrio ferrophilus]|uniref:FeoB-associated Cys-rich membrane protein n=1 Tax=Desulfovibrio ferrophilus TaxID=241368 RepID=A0A2Z6B212_9BACT|nr:FeoB-associated Cys-rich membrane protein [Desulfovibrio ferrophilus]BBD09559.1 uncharacterized protein DFE_2833 [Desulfovibrio ferrophilus]
MTGTIDLSLVLAIVAVAAIYLIRRHLRNKKTGNLGCGCGGDTSCSGCGQASTCTDPHKSDDLPMAK